MAKKPITPIEEKAKLTNLNTTEKRTRLDIDYVDFPSEWQKTLRTAFLDSHNTMIKVKNNFGYSGQNSPNCMELDAAIKRNEKAIEELK